MALDGGWSSPRTTSRPDVTTEYLHRIKQHAFLLGLDGLGNGGRQRLLASAEGAGAGERSSFELLRDLGRSGGRDGRAGHPHLRRPGGPGEATRDQAIERAIAGNPGVAPLRGRARSDPGRSRTTGGITATPEQMLKLVKADRRPPTSGSNLDTGNFHGADPYAEIAELAPYAVNVQAQDRDQPQGEDGKRPDLAKLVGLLRDARLFGVRRPWSTKGGRRTRDEGPSPRHIKTLRGADQFDEGTVPRGPEGARASCRSRRVGKRQRHPPIPGAFSVGGAGALPTQRNHAPGRHRRGGREARASRRGPPRESAQAKRVP